MRVARVWMFAVAASAGAGVAGCGGGGYGGDGTGVTTPVFTTLSVTPTTATIIVGSTQALTATARDQKSAAMSGLTVAYTSSNQSVATVTSAGVVTAVAVGTARITATGTVGSVTKTANVDITVTGSAPLTASVTATAASTFDPSQVLVARNGSVTWTFAMEHNVTFDGSGAPANIPTTASGSVSRAFPNAGSFPYHCTLHTGMNGTVVVP
jgi:plastocyanin